MSPLALLAPIQSKYFFLYEPVSYRVYPFVSSKDFANQAEHTPTQIPEIQDDFMKYLVIFLFYLGLDWIYSKWLYESIHLLQKPKIPF